MASKGQKYKKIPGLPQGTTKEKVHSLIYIEVNIN